MAAQQLHCGQRWYFLMTYQMMMQAFKGYVSRLKISLNLMCLAATEPDVNA